LSSGKEWSCHWYPRVQLFSPSLPTQKDLY
jgi:hypothetical protein